MVNNLIKVSKTISYALRHNPQEFGLELDAQGWTSVDKLLSSLQSRKGSNNIILEDIDTATMVAKRRTGSPVILKVRAKDAFAAEVFFSKETNGIWLSNSIPEKFIEN